MKRSKWVLLTLSLASTVTFAGPSSGGGGAQIESEFRNRAYALIERIASSPKLNTLCDADIMKHALESTKIRLVDQLVNPTTQEPITKQHLDAYTVPGDMQLLEKKWDHFLNAGTGKGEKSIDTLIAHEIYRATNGACDDEAFKISNKITALLDEPGKYSQIYKFTTHAQWSDGGLLCEAPATDETVQTCLDYGGGELAILKVYFKKRLRDDKIIGENVGVIVSSLISDDQNTKIQRLAPFASDAQPFYFVVDLQEGGVSVGFDLQNLIHIKDQS